MKKLLISLFSGVLLLAGCGDEKKVQDPPRTRTENLFALYEALDNHDYEKAISKIQRLRKIDEGNVFLANLEIIAWNNLCAKRVQDALDAQNYRLASETIEKALKERGMNDSLVTIRDEIENLRKILGILSIFASPEQESESLRQNALNLKQIATASPSAGIFLQLAEEKIRTAEILAQWENRMAELDLLSDYMAIRDKGDPMLAGTIFAEIQIEGLTDKLPVKSETVQPVPNQ